MDIRELIDAAYTARERSYSPYSHFAVGAALLCADGKVYPGCNIENASYSMTNCAERTAFFRAVSAGEKEFTMLAVCGGPAGEPASAAADYCMPCGACRQVMAEFCDPEKFEIIVCRTRSDYKEFKLFELLPGSFGAGNLDGTR